MTAPAPETGGPMCVRNRRRITTKAHAPSLPDPAPFDAPETGRCGRVVHSPERVPVAQTDPADRCLDCFPPAAELVDTTT